MQNFYRVLATKNADDRANFTTTQYLHLYVNPELHTAQMKQLEAVVAQVLEKNKGLAVEHTLSLYIEKDEKRKV